MNTRFLRPASGGNAAPGCLHDDTIGDRDSIPLGPACCCPARPAVRVVMPATAARPHQAELLLSGHHYRVSCQALAEAGATVAVLAETPGGAVAALLPGLPAPRVPAR